MNIRKTLPTDLDAVMEIYASAREFMKSNGNPDQWGDNYPPRELIETDIASGAAYVAEEQDEIVACFFFKIGVDPTYVNIYDGQWLDDQEYGVIHRIAVKYHGRNIIGRIFNHFAAVSNSLRIDTHRDNKPMQRSLEKNGFKKCGIIYLENGEERIAFQRICGKI